MPTSVQESRTLSMDPGTEKPSETQRLSRYEALGFTHFHSLHSLLRSVQPNLQETYIKLMLIIKVLHCLENPTGHPEDARGILKSASQFRKLACPYQAKSDGVLAVLRRRRSGKLFTWETHSGFHPSVSQTPPGEQKPMHD